MACRAAGGDDGFIHGRLRRRGVLFGGCRGFLFDGCASSQDSEESEAPASSAAQESAVDVKKLADDMYAAMTFDDEMMELSAEVLPNIYEYDPEEVVDFKVYTCATGGSADEVAVFLADDDAGMEYIEQMVGYRLDTLRSNFEDYRPEEMSKIENAKVLTNGYVTALVVSNDTSARKRSSTTPFNPYQDNKGCDRP